MPNIPIEQQKNLYDDVVNNCNRKDILFVPQEGGLDKKYNIISDKIKRFMYSIQENDPQSILTLNNKFLLSKMLDEEYK